MSDLHSHLHTMLRGLVLRHWGPQKQSAAAREIAEFWAGRDLKEGEVDFGGFSRKMNNSRDWSFYDAVALASITGSSRILEAFQDLQRPVVAPSESHHALVARAAKESGEGIEHSLNEGNKARAYWEADDAEKAWSKVKDSLRADMGGEPEPRPDNTVPLKGRVS